MIGAILKAAASAVKNTAKAVAKTAKKGVRGKKPSGGLKEAYEKLHAPPKQQREGLASRALNIGWTIDTWEQRLSGMFPRYAESIHISVSGRRDATIQNMYLLAMALLVGAWQKGVYSKAAESIRVQIDRTGKSVTIDWLFAFEGASGTIGSTIPSVNGGLTTRGDSSPFKFFHQPDWLNNEIGLPGIGIPRLAQMPAVIMPNFGPFTAPNINPAATDAELIRRGDWTANKVANLPFGEAAKFVTSAMAVNPAPADGVIGDDNWPALIESILLNPCRTS